MADRSETFKQIREIWSQVRAFALIWLAFTSLGGFFVLVGGPWAIALLTGIFGEAAALPGRVITLLMVFALPFAIYFFIQQKRLDNSTTICEECGERYEIEHSSCPMCGTLRATESSSDEQTAGGTAAAKS
jgi:ribosomal protein L37E